MLRGLTVDQALVDMVVGFLLVMGGPPGVVKCEKLQA